MNVPRVEHSKPGSSMKRRLSCSPSTSPEGFNRDDEPRNSEPINHHKRTKQTLVSSNHLSPQTYAVIHEVLCDKVGQGGHARHKREEYYTDTPRLWHRDSKANPLRGRRRIYNIPQFLSEELEENVDFVVYNTYDCGGHCAQYEATFEPLRLPHMPGWCPPDILPYFFALPRDGEAARATSSRIQVVSDRMRDAMTTLSVQNQEHFGHWHGNIVFEFPYADIYFGRPSLDDFFRLDVLQCLNSSMRSVQHLVMYVEKEQADDWAEADRLFDQGVVTARHFWKLFGPGEVLVTLQGNHPLAYSCYRSRILQDSFQGSVEVEMYHWTFNGVFEKEMEVRTLHFPTTTTEVAIDSLDLFPLRYAPNIEERLINRGRRFWHCRIRDYVTYEGGKRSFEIHTAHPRYMIDTSMYNEMHVDNEQVRADATQRREPLNDLAMQEADPPDDNFLLLLPSTIPGYGFHDKKWRTLYVENIKDIQWNKDAFDHRLVLKTQKKELIKALVSVHLSEGINATSDIIEGKGNGLIILLHGGPGTGKTLTAESVAELAQRPLYRVTCGDIGTGPEEVEKYLESVLSIGAIWSCVVLLDEADVFLEERTQTDLQRNALVSVFLRVLEYYDGILILTSNRIGTFDEAFKSRIQLAIHYPPLDEDGRFEIWNNLLLTLKEEVHDFQYEEVRRKQNMLARHKLNGREIRNIINTARQLSKFKKEALSYGHFHQAIEVASEFEQYVEETHGHTNEEWVKSQKIRNEG